MSRIHEARLKLRSELEAPPALRRLGSGWISGVLGLALGVAGLLLVLSLRAPGSIAAPGMVFAARAHLDRTTVGVGTASSPQGSSPLPLN